MAEKILFITLSNIGDVVLTMPALDGLRSSFPGAKITCVTSERAKPLFSGSPACDELIVFDKRAGLREKIRLFFYLSKKGFDIIADMRNSFLGAILPARLKTNPFIRFPGNIRHMKDRHLYRIKAIIEKRATGTLHPGLSLAITRADAEMIDRLLESLVKPGQKTVVISPGARSHTKRWAEDKFIELSRMLAKDSAARVFLVGDKDDAAITSRIASKVEGAVDLAGKTNFGSLAYLSQKSALVITNDSAVLHVASYVNAPVLAIFGITDESFYGPWSGSRNAVASKPVYCRPCGKAQCGFDTLKCIDAIKPREVFALAKEMLTASAPRAAERKRILIARTDRIGDVLLSTPVIKALRDRYPWAYIAMMVSPYAKGIVEGNPYLDEVIVYDKDSAHKGWVSSVFFALKLKRKMFDMALILHPTNRVHMVTFFAGIPKRIGYDRKMGYLLTDRIKHTKESGEKHELEYNLDLAGYAGAGASDTSLYMPIDPKSEEWTDELFIREGIKPGDKLLAIHPGASCVSKLWPVERFAQAADVLSAQFGLKTLIIAGPKDTDKSMAVLRNMEQKAIDLGGKTSVSQLASVLKRCELFISNDSGPVHIACAVGVPVISIFGRKQPGLSPKRWGPVGEKDKILHKDAGCVKCLAHDCAEGFKCLFAISVDDVLAAARQILKP